MTARVVTAFLSIGLASADALASVSVPTVTGLSIGHREHRQIKSPGEMVAELKLAGFPLVALAEACRVERKTLYNWIDGGSVRLEHQHRIAEIYFILSSATLNLRSLFRVWNQPGVDGRSLRDDLSSDFIDRAQVIARIDELRGAVAYYDKAESRKTASADRRLHLLTELPVADSQ